MSLRTSAHTGVAISSKFPECWRRLPRRPLGAPRNDIHDGDKIIEKFLDCGGKIFYNVRTYGNLLLERIFTMAKEYKITSLRLQDLEKEQIGRAHV